MEATKRMKNDLKQFLPFAGLIIVVIFFQIASGGMLLNIKNFPVFINTAFSIVVASCGAVFLMAQGNLDFSISANICLTAAITALVSHTSIPLAILTALVFGACIGMLNGIIHIVLGLPSFIATLAASFIYTGIANLVLGSGSLAADYGMKRLDNLPLKLIVLIVVLLLTFLVLEFSPFGKRSKAIGSRTEVARQSGVKIGITKAIPFVICGLSCGLVAIFSILRTCTASAQTGASMQINVILALLLGGIPFSGGWASRFRCVLAGSLLMSVITYSLIIMDVPVLTQQVIKGFLFVIAVAVSFDRKNTTVIK